MKIVKQGNQILRLDDPMKHIEQIGRTCYKSEDKITDESAGKFITVLHNNRHFAMLEHFRFIIEVRKDIYDIIEALNLRYFNLTSDNRFVISFSARALIEMLNKIDWSTSKYRYSSISTMRGFDA